MQILTVLWYQTIPQRYYCETSAATVSGSVRNFHLGGYSSGGLGNESPPVGSRGKAPVEGLGDLIPRS